MSREELIENIVAATNQSHANVLAMLAELDVQIETGLKPGRIVHLPNGTDSRPISHFDGRINVDLRVYPDLVKWVNVGFHGKCRNAQNVNKSEVEIMALWNATHPNDLVES